MINLKEPGEKVTSYKYDVNGRMESKTEPENTVTRYRYDKNGNLTEEIDPENISKKYTYDARNQVETETDGEGNVTKYGYDRVGKRELSCVVSAYTNAKKRLNKSANCSASLAGRRHGARPSGRRRTPGR